MKINKILVSQPTPAILEKSPYHEIHTKFGTSIDYRPFIKVEGVSVKEFRSQRIEILSHTAVIFTSRTTVDNFFRTCEEARISVPETMKYICNTEAVALYLQKYIIYRKRKIFFANGTFTNLMELILKHKSEKFLLVLSEPHKPEIPQTLEKLKINFNKVILSRTVSADLSGMKPNEYDMLVFFSPSEITALTSAFGNGKLPLIAVFGDGTARAAADARLTVSVMAPTPEAPSMAKAIEIFIRKVNAGEKVAPVVFTESQQADEFIKSQEGKGRKVRSAQPQGGKATTPAKSATGKAAPAKAAVKTSANGASGKKGGDSPAAKKPAPKKSSAKSTANKPAPKKSSAKSTANKPA